MLSLKIKKILIHLLVIAVAAVAFFLWSILVFLPAYGLVTYPAGSLLQPNDVTSSHIRDGTILNADVSSTAAIDPLKLNLTTYIANAHVSSSAAIDPSKLNLTTYIANAHVSSSAAIVDTKLATISTAGKVNGAALTNLANIPAGAGSIPSANLGNLGMVFLASTTLSTASSSLTVNNLAARQHLLVIAFRGTLSSGVNGYVTFTLNDAGGTAYGSRYEVNGAADGVENTSSNFFGDYDGASDTSSSTIILNITNSSTTAKMITNQTLRDKGATTAPAKIFATSIWRSNARVTKIVMTTAGGQTMAAGSYMIVFGTTF